MMNRYTELSAVPWYRRSRNVNLLILFGFFGFAPLLTAACVICFTGDIYVDERDDEGFLITASPSTKYCALIALVTQVLTVVCVFSSQSK